MENEIIKRTSNLPANIEDIQKYIIIGEARMKAHRAKLQAIKRLDNASAAYEAALIDGQDAAENVIDAKAIQGEILAKRPQTGYEGLTSKGGRKPDLPENINHKQSHYSQEVYKHPETVVEAKAKAREKGELVTEKQVLRLIQENKPKPETPPLPRDKYNVILSDAPWKYGDEQNTNKLGGAVKHYPLMSIEELCLLDIKGLSADNSVLFLWVTSPLLAECFAVIEAWGFEYKASIIWHKLAHNMGHYNSVRHEFLLICTRGSYLPDNKKLFPSVVEIKRGKHSEKPEEFRIIIDKMYSKGKKIELFARKLPPKPWVAWGNEISTFHKQGLGNEL